MKQSKFLWNANLLSDSSQQVQQLMHNLVIISICTECFGKYSVTGCCCTGWWLFHSHLCIYTVHYWLVLYCTPHLNSLEKQQTVLPLMYVIVLNKTLQWLTPPNKGISLSWVFCMPLSSHSSTFPVCVFPVDMTYEFKAVNLDLVCCPSPGHQTPTL